MHEKHIRGQLSLPATIWSQYLIGLKKLLGKKTTKKKQQQCKTQHETTDQTNIAEHSHVDILCLLNIYRYLCGIMALLFTEYDLARNSHVLHWDFSIPRATSYSVNSYPLYMYWNCILFTNKSDEIINKMLTHHNKSVNFHSSK